MAYSKITKINIIGASFAVAGIISFFLVKAHVTKQRTEGMKSRERMAKANYASQHLNIKMSLNAGIQLDPSKMQLVQNLEIEMMSDMYNRMTSACHQKCIPPKYNEADLAKGESVCLDRCVAKYLDVHERIGKKLTTMSAQDEEMAKKMMEQQQPQQNG